MTPDDDGASFVRDLVQLRDEARTGVLEIEAEGVHTNVYVLDGRPVFAEQGTLRDTLGRVLVDRGQLTTQQYSAVIDHMTSVLVDAEQMRFGEAAIALGLLSAEQVREALAEQVRRKIVNCLQYEQPARVFYEEADALRQVAHFPCAPDPLVVEGIRRFWDGARTEPVLAPFGARFPHLTAPPAEVGDRLALEGSALRLLRLLDGTRTLEVVREVSPIDSLLTDQLLAALALLQWLSWRDAPVATQATAGRAPAPSPQEPVTEARRRELARRRAAALALQARRAREGGASERPRVSSRPPPDEHRARLEAEQAFQRGRQHAGYGQWAAAAKELRRAFKYSPDVEYELHAVWAEYRAAKWQSEREERRRTLEPLVEAALKRDRRCAIGHHVRGQLALLSGDEERALKSFRNAAALDPDDLEAQRHLRLLQRRLSK